MILNEGIQKILLGKLIGVLESGHILQQKLYKLLHIPVNGGDRIVAGVKGKDGIHNMRRLVMEKRGNSRDSPGER